MLTDSVRIVTAVAAGLIAHSLAQSRMIDVSAEKLEKAGEGAGEDNDTPRHSGAKW